MNKAAKPHQDHEGGPWDTGELGRSLEHAAVVEDESVDKGIDAALNLRPISIRLEQGLIEAFKLISARNKNIGYQPLMRQVLRRFASAEIKKIANEMQAEVRAAERAQKEAAAEPVRKLA